MGKGKRIAADPNESLLPITEQPAHPEYYNTQFGDTLPSTQMESIEAQMKSMSAPVTRALFQKGDEYLAQQKGSPDISAAEANQRFPEIEVPFTSPINPDVAQIMADSQAREAELQNIVANGPQDVFSRGARMATGFMASMLDPAALMIGGVAGAGLSGASKVIPALRSSVLFANEGGFLQTAVHSAAVGALMEPANAYLTISEHRDYSALQAVENIATFSAGYAGLRYVGGKVMRALRDNPPARAQAEEIATSQLLSGKQVDTAPITEQVAREQAGHPVPPEFRPNIPEHSYQPMDVSRPAGQPFYAGSPKSSGNLGDVIGHVVGEDYGHGLYLADDPTVANGKAASAFSTADGKIHQVSLSEGTNLVDLEKPLEGAARESVKAALEKAYGPKAAETLLDTIPGTEVFDKLRAAIARGELPASTIDQINQANASAGIHGYRYEGGTPENPHNAVVLFDPQSANAPVDRVTENAQFAPARELVPQPNEAQLKEIGKGRVSPETDLSFDKNAHDQFTRLMEQAPEPLDDTRVKELEAQVASEVKGQVEQGLLPESAITELEQVQKINERAKIEEKAIHASLTCLGRDV